MPSKSWPELNNNEGDEKNAGKDSLEEEEEENNGGDVAGREENVGAKTNSDREEKDDNVQIEVNATSTDGSGMDNENIANNEASAGEEKDEEIRGKDEPQADGLLTSSQSKKKRKRSRLPKKMPLPKITPPEGLAAVSQMNAGVMMNPQMMYHHAAQTQYMMAGGIAPAMMMAPNGGFPPAMMMAAANGGGGAPNAMVNNMMGGANGNFFSPSNDTSNKDIAEVPSYEMVTLYLPVNRSLGMVLEDNYTTGKPELKRLAKNSPIKRQIPIGFHSGCCISYMKSERIGYVEPKSAKECVELVAKSKEGATTKTVKMEMLLVQLEREMGSSEVKESKKGRARREKKWTSKYNALARYKEKYGDCVVLHSHSPALAKWVSEQREAEKKKLLSDEHVQQLEMLGFEWDHDEYLTMAWDDAYCALVRFKDRYESLPSSGSLYEWMEQQRKAVEDFTITLEHARKLLKLGMELPAEFTDGLDCAAGANIVEEGVGVDGSGPKSKKRKISQERSKELFWKSAEAARMFGFKLGDDVLKGLQDRVEVLKQANQSVNGWKSLIPDDGKEDMYSQHAILVLRHRAQYLAKSYLIAMEKMNEHTWNACCKMAGEELGDLGLTQFSGGKTFVNWNTHFRKANIFPHPGYLTSTAEREKNPQFRIFEYFPKAKEMFLEIANENKHQLTGKFMLEQFEEKILPTLERDSRDKECFDDGSKGQKMLVKLLANPPSRALILRWMGKLNIEWDPYTTRKGRAKDGGSHLSKRMSEASESGKYTKRRPKGKGMKKGQTQDPAIEEDHTQALDKKDIKYTKRRPKGKGLKKGQTQDPAIEEDHTKALDNEEVNIADII